MVANMNAKEGSTVRENKSRHCSPAELGSNLLCVEANYSPCLFKTFHYI